MSQGISWPALNQTVCALRFFYGVTLNRAELPERIAYARTPRKLPTILSADEVVHFLEAVPSLKTRAALTTAYAAGLRASETVSLKVTDIVPEARDTTVTAWCSRSATARVPRTARSCSRRSFSASCEPTGVWRARFPGYFRGRGDKPIDVQVLHSACRSATRAAGLTKKVSVHTLRTQLRHPSSREWRGHPGHPGAARPRANLSTTARYTQVATTTITKTQSPFDRLSLEVVPPAEGRAMPPALEVADIFRRHGP